MTDDKTSPSIPAAEETVGEVRLGHIMRNEMMTMIRIVQEDALPLCCYHCSQPFQSFETLSSHICTKAGAGKRHHR